MEAEAVGIYDETFDGCHADTQEITTDEWYFYLQGQFVAITVITDIQQSKLQAAVLFSFVM